MFGNDRMICRCFEHFRTNFLTTTQYVHVKPSAAISKVTYRHSQSWGEWTDSRAESGKPPGFLWSFSPLTFRQCAVNQMSQEPSEAQARVQESNGGTGRTAPTNCQTSKLHTRDHVSVLLNKTRPLPNLVLTQPISSVLSSVDWRKEFRLDSSRIHHGRHSQWRAT